MQSEPLVSVIMNCYNSGKYLREAIDSVYAQTYKNWEIIFWDNASTDNSAEIANRYDAHMRYFKADKTVPLGKARNLAIRKASGDLIAFLDCDDIWMPDKLEKQIVLFEDPRVAIAYSNFIVFSEETKKERALYRKTDMPSGKIFEALLNHYFPGLLTLVIRRKYLDGLQEWFDERFQVCEEADLIIRLSHDWHTAYSSEVLAKYRTHSHNWTGTRPELFALEYELMIRKYENLYEKEIIRKPEMLSGLKISVVYGRAVTALREGRNKEARRLTLPRLFKHPKFALVFFFSFLSYGSLLFFLKSINRSLPAA